MDRRALERLGHHVVSRRVALGFRTRIDLADSVQFTVRTLSDIEHGVRKGPTQRHKQSWLRELARWEPDLVPSISRAAASGSSSSSVSAAGFDQDDHVEQVGGSEALAPHVRMTVGPSAS